MLQFITGKMPLSAGMHVLKDQLLTPEDIIKFKGTNVQDAIVYHGGNILQLAGANNDKLQVEQSLEERDHIFRWKIVEGATIASTNFKDLVINIEVGLDYDPADNIDGHDPFAWCVTTNDKQTYGVQLGHLSDYAHAIRAGPYNPFLGDAGDAQGLSKLKHIQKGELKKTSRACQWPGYFHITISPVKKVVICRSAADDGFMVCSKFNALDFDENKDVCLDVYRTITGTKPFYIQYVKVRAVAIVV